MRTKVAAREWGKGVELDIGTASAKFKPDVEEHTFDELVNRYIEDTAQTIIVSAA